MGSTKSFRQPGANNSDGSKFSSKDTISNTRYKAARPKPILTIQEHLQDLSLLHWNQPIDEALDLHLHGLLPATGKTLVPNSWTKWPKNYCRAMIQLIPLVSASQANSLLTAKMALIGQPHRNIGTQPVILWQVLNDVKQRSGKKSRIGKKHSAARGANAKERGPRGGKSGKIGFVWSSRLTHPHCPLRTHLQNGILTCVSMILAATLLNRPKHLALVQRLESFFCG